MLSNRKINIGTCSVRLISADIHKPLLLLSWVFYMIQMVLIKNSVPLHPQSFYCLQYGWNREYNTAEVQLGQDASWVDSSLF